MSDRTNGIRSGARRESARPEISRCTGRRKDCDRFAVAGPVLLALALAACEGEVPRRDGGWDGANDAALEASAAVNSASLIAVLALRTHHGHDPRPGRVMRGVESWTGPFWDAQALAWAVEARVSTAMAAQANAQDAWGGRDTVDSALRAEMFRLADAGWEHTVDAAEASAAAWDALSSGVGAVNAAALSATRAAVEEMRAARENFFDAAASARVLWDSVTTSPDSAAVAVADAVDAAMVDYYRLPDEAADSTWNLLFDLEDGGSPAHRALYRAIGWQSGLIREVAATAERAAQQAVWESSAAYAAWEAAYSEEVVASEAVDAAAALLDYSKSRELTVLAAMAAREALDAAHAATEAWAAVSTSVRQPES